MGGGTTPLNILGGTPLTQIRGGWFWDGVWMGLGWFWDGFGMVLGWFWDGFGMVFG